MKINKLISHLFVLYVFFIGFEGFLRYLFVSIHVPILYYFRDIFLLVMFGLSLYYYKKRYSVPKLFVYASVLLYYGFIISLFNVGNISQSLFGIKILFPFLVGVLSFKILDFKLIYKYLVFILTILIIGMFYDVYFDFPWNGLEYSIGSTVMNTSRDWQMGLIDRISGLSRTSFNAGILILLLSLIIYSQTKSVIFNIINIILSFVAIILTTTKGLILIYLIIISFITFNYFFLKIKSLGKTILLFTFSLSALILIWAYVGTIDIYSDDTIVSLILNSFYIRITDAWPNGIDFIINNGSIFFGRGLGGIGSAQIFFESNFYNPADNNTLLLYGFFGFFGPLFFIILLFSVKIKIINKEDFLMFLILFVFFGYGIVANTLDSNILSFMAGIGIAHFRRANEYLYRHSNVK